MFTSALARVLFSRVFFIPNDNSPAHYSIPIERSHLRLKYTQVGNYGPSLTHFHTLTECDAENIRGTAEENWAMLGTSFLGNQGNASGRSFCTPVTSPISSACLGSSFGFVSAFAPEHIGEAVFFARAGYGYGYNMGTIWV